MTALVASSLADGRCIGCVGGGCDVPGKRELDPQPVEIRKERISTGWVETLEAYRTFFAGKGRSFI